MSTLVRTLETGGAQRSSPSYSATPRPIGDARIAQRCGARHGWRETEPRGLRETSGAACYV